MACAVAHPANWCFGWTFVLIAFLSGAILGLQFHRDEFLGGYASLRRRLVRLGHICFAALGMLNVLFALSPLNGNRITAIASLCWMAGSVAMPAVCFLSAWCDAFRRIFFIPVATLIAAVIFTLIGGST